MPSTATRYKKCSCEASSSSTFCAASDASTQVMTVEKRSIISFSGSSNSPMVIDPETMPTPASTSLLCSIDTSALMPRAVA